MTNQLRTDLIAIFVRRGHKGKEIVEMVREIEALIDGQRCEWTALDKGMNYWGTGCGERVYSPDDSPYCPRCGKRIEVKDGQ